MQILQRLALRTSSSALKWLSIVVCSQCLFLFSVTKISAAVLINEFSSYESSGDWVEIYTDEAADVDISGWYLKDSSSNIGSVVPGGTKIGPSNKYYVFEVDDRLNKNDDTIYLYKPDNSVASQISYGGSGNVCAPESAGQTIGRYEDGFNLVDRFSSGTKGSSNAAGTKMPCPTPTPQNTNTPTNTPTPTAAPTSTNTPTSKTTKTPTPTKELEEENEEAVEEAQVLSTTNENLPSITPLSSPTPSDTPQMQTGKVPLLAFVFMGGGVLAIGTSTFLFMKNRKRI